MVRFIRAFCPAVCCNKLRNPVLPLLFLAISATAGPAVAGVIYVDNRAGNDGRTGTAPVVTSSEDGPVRTIRKALRLADTGDTIIIANHGEPYHEALTLSGARHSGLPDLPFTIIGNGAVLDGSLPVPYDAWRRGAENVWSFKPWRKGFYQLIRDGAPVPEVKVETGAVLLPEIPAGHWAAWRGQIWFRPHAGFVPSSYRLSFAVEQTGITMYAVRNVRISGLEIRYFRQDGVNAHDLCDSVLLHSVKLTGNGRSGVTTAGTSSLSIMSSELSANRLHSLLITENSIGVVLDSRLSQPPDLQNMPGQQPVPGESLDRSADPFANP